MKEVCLYHENIIIEPTMESVIDSLITDDKSMEECQGKVVTKGFSQQEGELTLMKLIYSSCQMIRRGRGSFPRLVDACTTSFGFPYQ